MKTAGLPERISMTERELIQGCLESSLKHQRELYHRYAPKMMGVCMRYAGSEEEAEDMLQEGFLTVFRKIETYAGTGELGAWIRRVMVNTALMYLRKMKKFQVHVEIEEVDFFLESNESLFSGIAAGELMQMIQQLPAGYRTVFNLYAIEGYNHREIGEQLGISSGTSKSQYSRAREMLRKMIETEREKASRNAIWR